MSAKRKGLPIVDLRPRSPVTPKRTSPMKNAKTVSPSSSTGPFVSIRKSRKSPRTQRRLSASPERQQKYIFRTDPSWEAQWSFETPRRELHKLKIDQGASYARSLTTSQDAFDFILYSTRCSRAIALCALLQTNGLVEDAITLILSKSYHE